MHVRKRLQIRKCPTKHETLALREVLMLSVMSLANYERYIRTGFHFAVAVYMIASRVGCSGDNGNKSAGSSHSDFPQN